MICLGELAVECTILVLRLAVLLAIIPVNALILLLEIKIAVFAALLAAQKGAQSNPHDCRKNFSGSSKAMESSVCEELFRKKQYKVMVTDEDTSSEARIKFQVNPDIEKWSDMNHVVRILGKLLYEAKTTNFGPKT